MVRNIQEQANLLQKALTTLTGHLCSVSIKLLEPNESDPDKAKVLAFVRDATSASQRGRVDGQQYHVSDNSAFEVVYRRGKAVFVCDDLIVKAAEGQYINRRPGWEDDYRATIVTSIFETDPQSSGNRPNTLGFVCADNRGGEFENNHDAQRCLFETAWRLSVMIYRYNKLKLLINPTQKDEGAAPPKIPRADSRSAMPAPSRINTNSTSELS